MTEDKQPIDPLSELSKALTRLEDGVALLIAQVNGLANDRAAAQKGRARAGRRPSAARHPRRT